MAGEVFSTYKDIFTKNIKSKTKSIHLKDSKKKPIIAKSIAIASTISIVEGNANNNSTIKTITKINSNKVASKSIIKNKENSPIEKK